MELVDLLSWEWPVLRDGGMQHTAFSVRCLEYMIIAIPMNGLRGTEYQFAVIFEHREDSTYAFSTTVV